MYDIILYVVINFFRILLKKSGSQVPRIELEEMGPSLDLVMRRSHLASDDLMKQACKQPKATKVCTVAGTNVVFSPVTF